MKRNKQGIGRWQKFLLEPFFPQIFAFIPWLKMKKMYFVEDSIFHEFHCISQIPNNSWKVIPELWEFWSSHLWYSSLPALQKHQSNSSHKFLSCFLPPPNLEFIIHIKKYFLLDFPKYWRAEVLLLQNGLFLWKLVILSWPRNPELIGYFMEFFGE